MKYSVLMGIYNQVDVEFLKESIDSVLNQTKRPDQFVIVKDGPLTEEQETLLNEYQKKEPNLFEFYPLTENHGPGYIYKHMISKCRYDYVTIMDSDDIACPSKNEEIMKVFEHDPTLDIVGTNVNEFMSDKGSDRNHVVAFRKLPETQEEISTFCHQRCPISQPSAIFKKDSILRIGGYQEKRIAEDWDVYIRLLRNGGKAYNIQKTLHYMRVNADFYNRRGGFSYLKKIMAFKYENYKNGYFSLKDYMKTAMASFIVCIMPNQLRTFVYKKCLRKKENAY